MDSKNITLNNIKNNKFIIGVIGLGYVGLPLVIRFAEEGFPTFGFDIDAEKVKILNAGETYIKHIYADKIKTAVNNGFKATTDFSEIVNVDAIIICVPTPLDNRNEPDLSFIHNTLESIKSYLKENQLLILESTTYPGPGGHCIPIDPFYLTWKAKQVGIDTRFIELAGAVNTAMPNYVVEKADAALASVGKKIEGSRILVLGLAYKKNVDDTRESPSLTIIDMLIKKGAVVEYSDPHLSIAPKTRKFDFELKSIELNEENIKTFDLTILLTDHDDFDYQLIAQAAKLIIDTRGRFHHSSKIHRA